MNEFKDLPARQQLTKLLEMKRMFVSAPVAKLDVYRNFLRLEDKIRRLIQKENQNASA